MPLDLLTYLIGGVAAGALVAFFVSRAIYRNSARLEELEQLKLENTKLKSDYDQYRSDVREHFVETAEILNKINDDHKQLYQSVASNVAALCIDNDSNASEPLAAQMRDLAKLGHDEADDDEDQSVYKPD